jgi:AcrR family transcriptional regulator
MWRYAEPVSTTETSSPGGTAASGSGSRRPGRPRSEASRRAILDAAYRLVMECGYPEVTAQMIAEAAGAGKQTLYRWWPSKAAVILDAVADRGRTTIDQPQEAAIRAGDLETFLRAVFAAVAVHGPVLRHLMAEAQADPALRRMLLERLIERRRDALRRLLAARLPDPARREAAVSLIYGAVWYRLMLDEPLDDRLAADIAALLCASR